MVTGPPSSDAGAAHQQALAARGARKALGAYYTPDALVAGVLDLALDPVLANAAAEGADAVAALRVADPACGDGRFLVAAGERVAGALERLGVDGAAARRHVAQHVLAGVDVDPAAVRLARAALRAFGGGGDARRVARQVVAGDGLLDDRLLRLDGFDVVVGNPPFLSQLGSATARSPEDAARLRARIGDALGAYTDPAAAFLLLAVHLARPAGRVGLVQPMSVLAARDAAGVRAGVLERAGLSDLWVVGDAGFDAAVEVCVPILARPAAPARVRSQAVDAGRRTPVGQERTHLHRGLPRNRAGDAPAPSPGGAPWSGLLAALDELPQRALRTGGTLGELASATADFRDQYYGLASHVVDRAVADDRTQPRLVTVGLVDPARLLWGERPTRFNKVRYQHPRVLRDALALPMRTWADARLVPKVLLATQTRVLEAVVDERGSLLPSVPVISIVAHDEGDLWPIAAVLTCPAVALLAVHRHLGAGRNARALRLRAAEVLELPVPADRARWADAAERLRAGRPLAEVGSAMDAAYGLDGDDELLRWWLARLPAR